MAEIIDFFEAASSQRGRQMLELLDKMLHGLSQIEGAVRGVLGTAEIAGFAELLQELILIESHVDKLYLSVSFSRMVVAHSGVGDTENIRQIVSEFTVLERDVERLLTCLHAGVQAAGP